jgi:hypothetical protein
MRYGIDHPGNFSIRPRYRASGSWRHKKGEFRDELPRLRDRGSRVLASQESVSVNPPVTAIRDRRSRPKIVVNLVLRDESEPGVAGDSLGIQRGARVAGKASAHFSVRLLRA